MSYSESGYEDAYRRLLCAVVIQAVRDLGSQSYQREAALFFATDWFAWMAVTLGMNPSDIANKINTGEYIAPKRSAYHTSGKKKAMV